MGARAAECLRQLQQQLGTVFASIIVLNNCVEYFQPMLVAWLYERIEAFNCAGCEAPASVRAHALRLNGVTSAEATVRARARRRAGRSRLWAGATQRVGQRGAAPGERRRGRSCRRYAARCSAAYRTAAWARPQGQCW